MAPELVTRFQDLPNPEEPITLAIGAFDGLHRGHTDILRFAASREHRVGILRFYPHPARVLRPLEAPPLLCSEAQIQELLGELGVSVHLRLPFTDTFAQQEPEVFLEDLHRGIPGLRGVVVGPDWRFGLRGRGDIHLLRAFAQRVGFEVNVLPDSCWNGERISSTRIRKALTQGDLGEAKGMLGRPYRLSGTVRDGRKFGRKLGFPTANFFPEQEVLPPQGVYAMRALVEGVPHGGAGYITHDPPLVEVHLLDYSGDLYGQRMEVDLVDYRRPATPIPDPDLLRERISKDVEEIRRVLGATL